MKKLQFAVPFVLLACTLMLVDCSPKPANPEFVRHDIDTAPPLNPWVKIAADVDLDGYADIVVGGQKGPLIWYHNPDWKKHLIAEGGYDTVDGESVDMDNDGDPDLVLGGLVWYENPGNLNQNPNQVWESHRIANHKTHDIEIADVNRDGLPDVVTRNQSAFSNPSGNTIHIWYHQPMTDTLWSEDIINCPHGEGIKCIDLDNDGDDDIITGGLWYENIAGDEKPEWKEHKFCEWHPNASVEAADINKDGRKDIFLTPAELAGQYYKIAWFEAPENQSSEEWREHLVADSVECVIHSLRTADFNKDGLPYFVYAEMHQGKDPDEVVVLLNEDKGSSWKKMVVFDKGSHCIAVLDYNNDGSPDFFGANWSGKYQPLQLWENRLNLNGKK